MNLADIADQENYLFKIFQGRHWHNWSLCERLGQENMKNV